MENTQKSDQINSNKKTIIFLISRRADQEIRTPKIMDVLKKTGYNTILLNWDRNDTTIPPDSNYSEIQLKFKALTEKKVIFYWPIWWIFLLKNLLKLEWDVVYSVNFDSILPALIAAKIKRKKVIYELLDIVELSNLVPPLLNDVFLFFDKILMNLSDVVVCVDEMQKLGIGGIPNKHVEIIYDSPPYIDIEEKSPQEFTLGKFTLFYAGALFKSRNLNLENVLSAIKSINGTQMIIAGEGDMVETIRIWEKEYPDKVRYLGKITYRDVIIMGLKSDLFFILRDANVPANRYTCGSTIFNAMRCGKPILANKNTSTSNIVLKEKCGLCVDEHNVEEIRNAILKLKADPKLCNFFGANARKAYDSIYSWEIMSQKIIDLVSSI